jgi:hypothetical protein
MGRRSGAPFFLDTLVRWPYVHLGVNPDVDYGRYDIWVNLHRMSICAEMHVALRGPKGHALKVDRVMLDLIVKLKADCHEIQYCYPMW